MQPSRSWFREWAKRCRPSARSDILFAGDCETRIIINVFQFEVKGQNEGFRIGPLNFGKGKEVQLPSPGKLYMYIEVNDADSRTSIEDVRNNA